VREWGARSIYTALFPVRMSLRPPTVFFLHSLVFTGLLAVTAIAAVVPPREKFLAAFAPLYGGPASISPDGTHVAYLQREKGEPAISIVELASALTVFRAVVGKEDNRRSVGETSHIEPVRITFLRWADNRRVVRGFGKRSRIFWDGTSCHRPPREKLTVPTSKMSVCSGQPDPVSAPDLTAGG
jgi:hypothetical protein